jgi:2-polyprenyl-6-methoxyphenol hydroxylase-like FAD-dependent oxidoreductase
MSTLSSDSIRKRKITSLPDVQGSANCAYDESIYSGEQRFYSIAPLPSSSSPSGRVVLIGDAAHALPPTGGQGAAMALEDAGTLANALARLGVNKDDPNRFSSLQLCDTPSKWQAHRQKRIAKITAFSV